MAERMGRFLSALHSANQPKVKVGDKIETIKGGQVPGTVEKVKPDGSVSFRHPDGKLYRTHHTNVRVVKEEVEQTDEAIKPKSKEDEGEYGYEGDMAMSQLRSIIRNSQAMLDNLDEKTDLPEWVQSKITLAKDYIETSANYLMSELEEATGPGFMLLPGAKRTPAPGTRAAKPYQAGVGGKQEEKPEEQKPTQTVVNRGKVFREAMYSGPERRNNKVARAFIDARKNRAIQRKKLGEPVVEKKEDKVSSKKPKQVKSPANQQLGSGYFAQVQRSDVYTKLNSGDYVADYANLIIEKKRNAKKANNVTNMDPELNTSGTNLNTTPTMDASSPEPGKK